MGGGDEKQKCSKKSVDGDKIFPGVFIVATHYTVATKVYLLGAVPEPAC